MSSLRTATRSSAAPTSTGSSGNCSSGISAARFRTRRVLCVGRPPPAVQLQDKGLPACRPTRGAGAEGDVLCPSARRPSCCGRSRRALMVRTTRPSRSRAAGWWELAHTPYQEPPGEVIEAGHCLERAKSQGVVGNSAVLVALNSGPSNIPLSRLGRSLWSPKASAQSMPRTCGSCGSSSLSRNQTSPGACTLEEQPARPSSVLSSRRRNCHAVCVGGLSVRDHFCWAFRLEGATVSASPCPELHGRPVEEAGRPFLNTFDL